MSICTSNLTSGFIDLATYDEQEKYLYGGPDAVAYFVREIRKATWFTQVPVCLSSRSGQPGFGQQWSVSISRAGDYLLYSWLRLTLNSVTAATANNTLAGSSTTASNATNGVNPSGAQQANHVLRWSRNFMHNIVQECAITFNDLVAARFDSFHLDFWSAFTVPAGKRNGYNNMIGNVDALVNPVAIAFPSLNQILGGVNNPVTGLANGGINVNSAGQQVLPAATLNLPLPFFFSRDSGLALPTAALPYNEMRINFAFRNLSDLLTLDTYYPVPSVAGVPGGQDGYWVSRPAQASDLSTSVDAVMGPVNVWANYAIVSNDERKKMACAPRDILIEQVQTAPIQNFNPTTSAPIDIRFSHAIKALFWGARNVTIPSAWSNYTTSQQLPLGPYDLVNTQNAMFGVVDFNSGVDPIASTSLIYENTQRLYQMGSDYFSLVNPWYHAPVIPLETGYHLYSYSLDFFAIDPMGSTNYGKLTNVSIVPQGSADAVSSAQATVSTTSQSPFSTFGILNPPGYPVVALPGTVTPGYGAKYSFITTAVNNNIIRISGGKPQEVPPTVSCYSRCNISWIGKQCKILPGHNNICLAYNLLVDIALSAKLSNCWKPLRALDTTLIWKQMSRTSRNGVGIVKILEIGQSAAKSYCIYTNATERVQRLNGSWDFLKSLRYSLLLCESKGTNGSWLSSSMRIYTKKQKNKKTKKQKNKKFSYKLSV